MGASKSFLRPEGEFRIMVPWIGAFAATLTSLSYLPQLQKAWPRGSTADLSIRTLTILTAGLLLWLVYGMLKKDWVIVSANTTAKNCFG
jgi:MtN3 and saliva related transmembrane protein